MIFDVKKTFFLRYRINQKPHIASTIENKCIFYLGGQVSAGEPGAAWPGRAGHLPAVLPGGDRQPCRRRWPRPCQRDVYIYIDIFFLTYRWTEEKEKRS